MAFLVKIRKAFLKNQVFHTYFFPTSKEVSKSNFNFLLQKKYATTVDYLAKELWCLNCI